MLQTDLEKTFTDIIEKNVNDLYNIMLSQWNKHTTS